MTENSKPQPSKNLNYVYLAALLPSMVFVIIHASRTDALSEPITYLGIAVGLVVVASAWFISGRKR